MGKRGITADASCYAHYIRILGAASDFDGAKAVFDEAPRPRSAQMWAEMIQACNMCGDPSFASGIVSDADAPQSDDSGQ